MPTTSSRRWTCPRNAPAAACATRSSDSWICWEIGTHACGLLQPLSSAPRAHSPAFHLPEGGLLVVARVAAGAAHVALRQAGRRFARFARRIRFGLARQARRRVLRRRGRLVRMVCDDRSGVSDTTTHSQPHTHTLRSETVYKPRWVRNLAA